MYQVAYHRRGEKREEFKIIEKEHEMDNLAYGPSSYSGQRSPRLNLLQCSGHIP